MLAMWFKRFSDAKWIENCTVLNEIRVKALFMSTEYSVFRSPAVAGFLEPLHKVFVRGF